MNGLYQVPLVRDPGYTLREWGPLLGERRSVNQTVGIDVGRDCCIRDRDVDPKGGYTLRGGNIKKLLA